ncbi:2-dehydropantoate 2-reductase [Opitutus sp. ER46]|uniref:2-dehydropantoate 2-reductase n=1 Tax=Opitutus sp. ER46 TaxID=2161864 RepID=UPI000D31157D|nr:2-dehydropantoate 2-reductase [Opitutus sp. ER46]PTX97858.1 2-dehydropantoate 2-reductase [Opitutus sp. ER46]
MPLAFPSIAVVGSGALGTYYGTRLGRAGANVRFLLRSDLPAVRARGSMVIHEKDGTLELRPAAVFGTTAEIGPVDLVLVTLKSTANTHLAELLPPLLGASTTILTLQNGLGSDEYLASLFGRERVVGGLAFIASTRTGPGEVTCYHPGSITLGELDRPAAARTHALAAQFTAAGVTMQVVDNLLEARWRKLVWNIPFNGLAVANNVTTDVLCADPAFAAEVRALMHEVQRAGTALGYSIPDAFLRQQFDVTPPMGAYQPSSLVDFRAGREVEVEAIWGEPLRRAEAATLPMPRLAALYSRLRSLPR